MRFGKVFQRRVGGSGAVIVLGADSAPAAGTPPSDKNNDNQLSWKLNDKNGFPIQRVAVGYAGPNGGLGLPTKLYVWDDNSQQWYQSASKTMTLGTITWFDVPVLGDSAGGTSAGALEVCLVVAAAGSDPNGTYVFAMGMDLSNAA